MKLFCNRCERRLTKNLYKAKVKWKHEPFFNLKIVANRGDVYDGEGKVKGGLFFIKNEVRKFNNYNVEPMVIQSSRPTMLVVGENSVLDNIIPPFREGCGCCNHSMGGTLTCSCGNTLGKMYLDCYEDGSVRFYEKSVQRKY